jgi:exosortase
VAKDGTTFARVASRRQVGWSAVPFSLPALTLTLAVGVLVWPAFAHAIEVWSTDEEFTYGFLIAPIALAIVWWRRTDVRRSLGHGSWAGLAIVGASILLMLISRRTGIHNLAGIAVSPLLVGVAVYLWGWRTARILMFPSAFLLFGLALYRGLLSSVGFVLQDITAGGAAFAGRAVGLDVVREGLVLHSATSMPQYAFVVAQACSGMSSLLSLLALASLWIYATRGSLLGRATVIAGVLPLVVLANTTRVTLVLLLASKFGEDAALGFFHGASSLVLFGVALGGLLMVSRIVGCRLPALATSS